MRIFELPEMEINRFSVDDVITMSGGDTSNTLTAITDKNSVAGHGIISDTISTYSISFEDMGA